jgi:glycosyltransferase involved in cell wall biosynthesis
MKIVILNCFETNENRVQGVYDYFINKDNEVIVIQSDFKHIMKFCRKDEIENHIFIRTKPYYKNLSVERLMSHYRFSKDAMSVVKQENPDILYVIFPPNSLVKFAAKYKKTIPQVKLIFDIMDLWPETLPIGKAKRFPPFTFWRSMRNKNLKYADFVITECDLFRTVLDHAVSDVKTKTIYLSKKTVDVVKNPQLSEVEIHLAYLGSINNIIDITMIREIIKVINGFRPVTLHIIGDGEKKEELINAAESVGATVKYYGKIYDSQEKQAIFDKCHFGLNIMKESVCVGLTMKSIDYFQHGLPILNNIKSDTAEIVERHKIGFNLTNNLFFETIVSIVNLQNYEILEMKERTYLVFSLLFSTLAFEQNFNNVMRVIQYDKK